jgi:molybdopterin biosynthesis enzyme
MAAVRSGAFVSGQIARIGKEVALYVGLPGGGGASANVAERLFQPFVRTLATESRKDAQCRTRPPRRHA